MCKIVYLSGIELNPGECLHWNIQKVCLWICLFHLHENLLIIKGKLTHHLATLITIIEILLHMI